MIDIGSNDGTTLSFYKKEFCRIGIDPTIKKFDQYYEPNILKCENFFSFEALQKIIGDKKAKVITSFAMFYDLDEPKICSGGFWHLILRMEFGFLSKLF